VGDQHLTITLFGLGGMRGWVTFSMNGRTTTCNFPLRIFLPLRNL